MQEIHVTMGTLKRTTKCGIPSDSTVAFFAGFPLEKCQIFFLFWGSFPLNENERQRAVIRSGSEKSNIEKAF